MLWFFKINISAKGFGRWIWDSGLESCQKACSKKDRLCPLIIITSCVSIVLSNWKEEQDVIGCKESDCL